MHGPKTEWINAFCVGWLCALKWWDEMKILTSCSGVMTADHDLNLWLWLHAREDTLSSSPHYLCIILDPQSEGGRKRREHSSVSGVVVDRHDGHIRAGAHSRGKAGSSRSLLLILYLIVLLWLAQHVVTARGVSLVMDSPAIQILNYHLSLSFLSFLNSGDNWETCKWGNG